MTAMQIRDRILYLVAAIVVVTGLALVALSGHRGARIETASGIDSRSGSQSPPARGGRQPGG